MQKLVIWGSGGHAKVAADIVRLVGQYEIAGFLDDRPEYNGRAFCGASILGDRERLPSLREQGISHAFIAIGDCQARPALAEVAVSAGFALAILRHPRAVAAADTEIGAGTLIAAGSVVAPGTVIGANVIINTAATVDHDCRIGDAVHIGPGVHLAGHVTVGDGAFLGVGACVRDRIQIGANVVIGAGTAVVHDLAANVIAYGVPDRVRGRR